MLEASRQFRNRFLSGDEKAIFQFVKACPDCFREVWPFPDGSTISCYSGNNIFREKNGRSWVIEQIERWRAEGTPAAMRKLKRLFTAYVDCRGRRDSDLVTQADMKLYDFLKSEIDKGKKLSKVLKGIEEELFKIADCSNSRDRTRFLKDFADKTGIARARIERYLEGPDKDIIEYTRQVYSSMKRLEKERNHVFGKPA
jgi:hypothetical protein